MGWGSERVKGDRNRDAASFERIEDRSNDAARGCEAMESRSHRSDRPGGAGWPPRSFVWARRDVANGLDHISGSEADEPATDGGIRLVQARPHAALGLP